MPDGPMHRALPNLFSIARRCAVLALLLVLACAGPAAADKVDLLLVLAVDASGSVDHVRFELQKQGYVAAFRNPRVLRAIRSGANQAIAVMEIAALGPDQAGDHLVVAHTIFTGLI